MDKNEFLKILKDELDISLDKDIVYEQIDYYDNYIANEVVKGKTEKEVITELGDPRLIAKTIKTVNNADGIMDIKSVKSEDEEGNDYSKTKNRTETREKYGVSGKVREILWGIIAFLVVFIIISLAGKFIFAIFSGIGSIGILLIVIMLMWFVMRKK